MSEMGSTQVIDPAQQPVPEPKRHIPTVKDIIDAIRSLILPLVQQQLVTILRIPSPQKVTKMLTVASDGTLGGGFTTPNPEEIYRAPVSAEAWLHRITVYSPPYPPANPLNTGQLLCTGTTAGEIIFYLPMEPDQTQVAPMQPVIEGRTSAPHLNPGEVMQIVGANLPAGIHIRIDIQLNLVTGVSEYTPRTTSPTNLDSSPISSDIS